MKLKSVLNLNTAQLNDLIVKATRQAIIGSYDVRKIELVSNIIILSYCDRCLSDILNEVGPV